MTHDKTGGPAFPGPSFTQNGYPNGHAMGMTLRDWFAGQALAGVLANAARLGSVEKTADAAYQIADAMLSAREVNK